MIHIKSRKTEQLTHMNLDQLQLRSLVYCELGGKGLVCDGIVARQQLALGIVLQQTRFGSSSTNKAGQQWIGLDRLL